MSTLQISLALLGVFVVAGVFAYNAWITRRSAPRTGLSQEDITRWQSSLPAGEGPEASRLEPVLGEGHEAGATGAGRESRLDSIWGGSGERRAGLNPLLDAIVPLALDHPVSGEALLAAMPTTRRVGSKPLGVEGQNMRTGVWEAPRAQQRYQAVQAGVQLANRLGPLNEIEFSEFVAKAQALADAVSAAPSFPDMLAEVARARELDAFANAHDAQLGLTLRAQRTAWSPRYIVQEALRQGFVAGPLPGRLVLPAALPGGAPVLSLQFDSQAAMADDPEQSALREVQLTLEVTHVPCEEKAFERLRQTAAALSQTMDARLTDDAGQPLTEATLNGIGADLERLHSALATRGLPAGSPLARRLFT